MANIEARHQSVLLHQFLDIAAALDLPRDQLVPADTKPFPAREVADMPESVLNAVKAIRKSVGPRTPSRR